MTVAANFSAKLVRLAIIFFKAIVSMFNSFALDVFKIGPLSVVIIVEFFIVKPVASSICMPCLDLIYNLSKLIFLICISGSPLTKTALLAPSTTILSK